MKYTVEEVRARFEAWLIREHEYAPEDLIWQEKRNCYADYATHLAWNAYRDAYADLLERIKADKGASPRVTERLVQAVHLYRGDCPDALQPESRDTECEACREEDAIRTHLLSQAAEIERLSQESAQQFIRARDWAELSGKNEDRASLAESRLAAANALLSRCFVKIGELTKGLDPHDPIYVELQQLGLDWMQHSEADTAHLSENTHDRA